MLDAPDVTRAVMASLGTAGPARTDALERSAAFWALAWAGEEMVGASHRPSASDGPYQLALAFRGALSFWSAGELSDDELRQAALAIADALAPALPER